MPDAYHFVRSVLGIDIGLLVFNILPIYPLDGGQILRSLLWFPLGRARSLMVATVLGMVGIVGFFGIALSQFRGFHIAGDVAGGHWRLHADELLGRAAARTGAAATVKIAAPARLCLSKLPNSAAAGRKMEVRALRAALRHLPDRRRLPALRGAVCHDDVRRLRQIASHE